MIDQSIKILLVEDNPGDARLIRESLAEAGGETLSLEWVTKLSEGLERLSGGNIDLVLLDLGLPDSRGLDTFLQAYAQAPQVPFVLLTGLDDATLALTTVRRGAQDYLIKGQTDSASLLRAIRYATERKRGEEALRRAHELVEAEKRRLFALLDGLPVTVYLRGLDYRILFANRKFREVFGEPDDQPCYQVLLGRTEPCEVCRPLEVLQTKAPNQFEWLHPRSNRTYEVYNYPFSDHNGPSLVLSLGIDITEHKQAEEALRESERRYRLLAENVTDVIWTMDLHQKLTYISPSIKLLTGYDPEKVLQQPWEEMLTPASVEAARKALAEALAWNPQDPGTAAKTWTSELEQYCQDGSTVWTEVKAGFLRDSQGRPEAILGVTRDIHSRKQAEEALRQSEARLAEAQRIAQIGNWEWYIQKNETHWSEEAFRIFHVSAGPLGLTYDQFLNYVHPDDRQRVKEAVEEALTQKQPYGTDFRVVLDNGAVRHLRAEGEVYCDEHGIPFKMLGTLQNITARKQVEEELRESEKKLRYLASQLLTAQEAERDRISRELHDELGQSLLVLKLQAKEIERNLDKHQVAIKKECLEMISRLDTLVDEVRRLSRDLTPTMLEDLGLSAALRRLTREFSRRHKVELDFWIGGIDDLFPRETQVNIYRIFQESLTNIGKYAQATRLTIEIKRGEEAVAFLIADNGRGFNVAEVMGREPTSRGMGLAAIQERVRMLGGNLEIWSQEGQGTRIAFLAPVRKIGAEGPRTSPAGAAPSRPGE